MLYIVGVYALQVLAWLHALCQAIYSFPYSSCGASAAVFVAANAPPLWMLKPVLGSICLFFIYSGFKVFDNLEDPGGQDISTKHIEEVEENDYTLVATPPSKKGKGKAGHLGFLGDPVTPVSRFFRRSFSPIQVWNVTIGRVNGQDSENPFASPYGNSDFDPNGPLSSPPQVEFGPAPMPTGREVGLPPLAAAHFARARRMVALLKAMYFSSGEDDADGQNGAASASEQSQDTTGLNQIIHGHNEDLGRLEKAMDVLDACCKKAEEKKVVPPAPVIPIIITPPIEPAPSSPALRGFNRTVSLVASAGCRAISILSPGNSRTIHLPPLPPPATAHEYNNPISVAGLLYKLGSKPGDDTKLPTKEDLRYFKMFAPVEDEYREKFNKTSGAASGREFLSYLKQCLVTQSSDLASDHVKAFLKANRRANDDAISAYLAELKEKRLLTPLLQRLFEDFEKEQPGGTKREWVKFYKEAMKKEQEKGKHVDEVKKKPAVVSKIPQPKRLSQGAFTTTEARQERRKEKATVSSPARKVGGVRVPQRRQLKPTTRSPTTTPEAATKLSRPPPTTTRAPAPITPPKLVLTAEFVEAACNKAMASAPGVGAPLDRVKARDQDRRLMKILAPWEEDLRKDFTEKMKVGGSKVWLQYLRNHLAHLRTKQLVKHLGTWAKDHPSGTVEDLALFINKQVGVEKFREKAKAKVELYYEEFEKTHPRGTAKEWTGYLEDRLVEEEVAEKTKDAATTGARVAKSEVKATKATSPPVQVKSTQGSIRKVSVGAAPAISLQRKVTPPPIAAHSKRSPTITNKPITTPPLRANSRIPTPPSTRLPARNIAPKSTAAKENVRPSNITPTAIKVQTIPKKVLGEIGNMPVVQSPPVLLCKEVKAQEDYQPAKEINGVTPGSSAAGRPARRSLGLLKPPVPVRSAWR